MIKLMNVKNIEGLLKTADEARGNVDVVFADGSRCDLKHNKTAREMLKALTVKNGELNLALSNREDMPIFLYYMATECA